MSHEGTCRSGCPAGAATLPWATSESSALSPPSRYQANNPTTQTPSLQGLLSLVCMPSSLLMVLALIICFALTSAGAACCQGRWRTACYSACSAYLKLTQHYSVYSARVTSSQSLGEGTSVFLGLTTATHHHTLHLLQTQMVHGVHKPLSWLCFILTGLLIMSKACGKESWNDI